MMNVSGGAIDRNASNPLSPSRSPSGLEALEFLSPFAVEPLSG
ncbi:MAG: hypothetical protein VX936_11255 [Planctomycetota bacterium]|nr:hypothetical protein [Planctomycetota bacterium]